MNAPSSLAADNIACLRQAEALLNRLSDSDYADGHPPAQASGCGAHLRHCLDHYDRFLAGWSAGHVDYDARNRDMKTETDRQVALSRLAAIIGKLEHLPASCAGAEMSIQMDCATHAGGHMEHSRSTGARELQFLLSHTIHHYALIGFVLRCRGVQVDRDFGVAPSTLRYRGTLPSCAP